MPSEASAAKCGSHWLAKEVWFFSRLSGVVALSVPCAVAGPVVSGSLLFDPSRMELPQECFLAGVFFLYRASLVSTKCGTQPIHWSV